MSGRVSVNANNPNQVMAAYEILLQELEDEIDAVNRDGAAAFGAGDHAAVKGALERAQALGEVRRDLVALGQRLCDLVEGAPPRDEQNPDPLSGPRGSRPAPLAVGEPLPGIAEPPAPGSEKRTHLGRGRKTPEEAYRAPILRVLVDMGGRGQTGAVLGRVYELVKDRLNEHDLAPLGSHEHTPRWRNAAEWCRNTLREDGLIVAGSPHGIWEISDEGRKWLQAQR